MAFPNRWVRFHSLSGSKRYAENDDEYVTVLDRHNRILGELAQHGERVTLITTGYSETAVPIRSYFDLTGLDPDAIPWRSVAMHQCDDNFCDTSFWHVFTSQQRWTPGVFDNIVRRVADDVLANVMFAASNWSWVIHTYDGGMDVFLDSSSARDTLKASYSGWLSDRTDGL